MQLSGNKVRKLEFLLADAVEQGADCIITIGGVQSNHCRATAVAARYLNLDCYLILRTSKVNDFFLEFLALLFIDLAITSLFPFLIKWFNPYFSFFFFFFSC